MLNYNINELEPSLKSSSSIVAIHGTSLLGKQVLYALSKRKIKVDFFIDSDEKNQNRLYCNINTISAEKFSNIAPNGHLFIAHDYFIPVMEQLKKLNFNNYYSSVDLLEKTDFSDGNEFTKMYPNTSPLKMERGLQTHKYSAKIADRVFNKVENNEFSIKHIDIVVTERCSLKCRDCANLMQYYQRPQNSDLNILFKSLDRMMQSVDKIYEFRVLGGDPFMNKEMYKVVNKLVKYNNVEQAVIYTNAKIIPKGDNLECLKDKKVRLDITNYGELSSKHDEITSLLDMHNIPYETKIARLWDDIGTIEYEKKTDKQLKELFRECCARDIFTLFDGTLFKCPVSAHGTKLKSVPFDEKYDG
ncbi:MAG: 4Fe-4S cluster-binding domain-containing protein, partial [SAR202 cluster bacterium]|nr:4Fe-4S cluster-binding domain-containing protein [SAR202 cluster bacterium]